MEPDLRNEVKPMAPDEADWPAEGVAVRPEGSPAGSDGGVGMDDSTALAGIGEESPVVGEALGFCAPADADASGDGSLRPVDEDPYASLMDEPSAEEVAGTGGNAGFSNKVKVFAALAIPVVFALIGLCYFAEDIQEARRQSEMAPALRERAGRLQDAMVHVRGSGDGGVMADASEVTVERFRQCVQAKACALGNFATRESNPLCNFAMEGPGADRSLHPMNCVDLAGAREYCAWKKKRLPTYADWKSMEMVYEGQRRQRPLPHHPSAKGKGRGYRRVIVNPDPEAFTFAVGSHRLTEGLDIVDVAGNVKEWIEWKEIPADMRDDGVARERETRLNIGHLMGRTYAPEGLSERNGLYGITSAPESAKSEAFGFRCVR